MNLTIETHDEVEQRKEKYAKLRRRHPEHYPITVTQMKNVGHPQHIDSLPQTMKYLVSHSMEWAQFIALARMRMSIKPEQGVIFFIDRMLPAPRMTISEIHALYADSVGFVQVTFGIENAFGHTWH